MSSSSITISFVLNGERVCAIVEPHQTILEVVRQQFSLYGARESCGQGLCGCCTIIVNGESVSGCLFLAAMADGGEVTTIEHLDAQGELDPVQQAFIECGAFQCGFCTSGFILMSRQLLDRNPDPSDAEIRHFLSGNLCRCAAYPEIIEAVKLAARLRRPAEEREASALA
jgi:carbon-monoxide dehydrogenase small subunit